MKLKKGPPTGKRINQTTRRTERLAALLELLSDGENHSIAALADHFGVVMRTLHRDIGELRETGLKIDGSAGLGGGIRLRREEKVA